MADPPMVGRSFRFIHFLVFCFTCHQAFAGPQFLVKDGNGDRVVDQLVIVRDSSTEIRLDLDHDGRWDFWQLAQGRDLITMGMKLGELQYFVLERTYPHHRMRLEYETKQSQARLFKLNNEMQYSDGSSLSNEAPKSPPDVVCGPLRRVEPIVPQAIGSAQMSSLACPKLDFPIKKNLPILIDIISSGNGKDCLMKVFNGYFAGLGKTELPQLIKNLVEALTGRLARHPDQVLQCTPTQIFRKKASCTSGEPLRIQLYTDPSGRFLNAQGEEELVATLTHELVHGLLGRICSSVSERDPYLENACSTGSVNEKLTQTLTSEMGKCIINPEDYHKVVGQLPSTPKPAAPRPIDRTAQVTQVPLPQKVVTGASAAATDVANSGPTGPVAVTSVLRRESGGVREPASVQALPEGFRELPQSLNFALADQGKAVTAVAESVWNSPGIVQAAARLALPAADAATDAYRANVGSQNLSSPPGDTAVHTGSGSDRRSLGGYAADPLRSKAVAVHSGPMGLSRRSPLDIQSDPPTGAEGSSTPGAPLAQTPTVSGAVAQTTLTGLTPATPGNQPPVEVVQQLGKSSKSGVSGGPGVRAQSTGAQTNPAVAAAPNSAPSAGGGLVQVANRPTAGGGTGPGVVLQTKDNKLRNPAALTLSAEEELKKVTTWGRGIVSLLKSQPETSGKIMGLQGMDVGQINVFMSTRMGDSQINRNSGRRDWEKRVKEQAEAFSKILSANQIRIIKFRGNESEANAPSLGDRSGAKHTYVISPDGNFIYKFRENNTQGF
ncbi:MAG: hypothetical protein K1X29_02935 [Bdellovibrionales bacterium]|nr:hypothetical protein [Bdellovibrionales bacterium]